VLAPVLPCRGLIIAIPTDSSGQDSLLFTMTGLQSFLLLSALVGSAAAQIPSNNMTVWSSVAFIMQGERTPVRGTLTSILTPAGAQQMYEQGKAFRARYLSGKIAINTTEDKITTKSLINGIDRNAIDNSDMTILAGSDEPTTTGAIAFMQGLFPPLTRAFNDNVGGLNVSLSTLTGTFTEYPLNGYQYPRIQTLSALEENSIL
jgi:hypothetical protein